MEASFAGEEFIDDSDLMDDISIEPVEKSKAKKGRKTAKKEAPKKMEGKEAKREVSRFDGNNDDIAITPVDKKEEEEKPSSNPAVTPDDPWNEEHQQEKGKAGSGWRTIAVIALILLIFSVYTNGFQFSGSENAQAGSLTLLEAEQKTVAFVNTNLLSPPFVAEVLNTEDAGSLYKVRLLVSVAGQEIDFAGQEIDSYLTKDGALFFPQGIPTADAAEGRLAALDGRGEEISASEGLDNAAGEGISPEEEGAGRGAEVGEDAEAEQPLADDEESPAESEVTEGSAAVVEEDGVGEEVPSGPAEEQHPSEFALTAKRWLFSPNKLTVTAGEAITFTIEPANLDDFTFAIPALNVEERVSGVTTIQFTPHAAGTYEFLCSSCEEFRGMTGTLVVE